MKSFTFPRISHHSIPVVLGGISLMMIGSLIIAHTRVALSPKFRSKYSSSSTPVKSWTWESKGLQAVSEASEAEVQAADKERLMDIQYSSGEYVRDR
ncbi:MAG: hypothetical protein LDL41_07880 [Coleofasciculus sp. S288]|nr:hypothetical protein [Coleofasciculus sp. S288]